MMERFEGREPIATNQELSDVFDTFSRELFRRTRPAEQPGTYTNVEGAKGLEFHLYIPRYVVNNIFFPDARYDVVNDGSISYLTPSSDLEDLKGGLSSELCLTVEGLVTNWGIEHIQYIVITRDEDGRFSKLPPVVRNEYYIESRPRLHGQELSLFLGSAGMSPQPEQRPVMHDDIVRLKRLHSQLF